MTFIVLVVLVLLFILLFILPLWYHHINVQFLTHYHCDKRLYNLLYQNRPWSMENLRIETSVKGGNDGRYVVIMLYRDYVRYSCAVREQLCKLLGFSLKNLDEFLSDDKITPSSDIIFGVDGSKGKIYLDYGGPTIRLKCLESDGTTKSYRQISDQANVTTVSVSSDNRLVSHHYYLKTPIPSEYLGKKCMIYWIAISTEERPKITYYMRPDLPLVNVSDGLKFITARITSLDKRGSCSTLS